MPVHGFETLESAPTSTASQSFVLIAAETSCTLCSARRKLISPRAQCIVFPVVVVVVGALAEVRGK